MLLPEHLLRLSVVPDTAFNDMLVTHHQPSTVSRQLPLVNGCTVGIFVQNKGKKAFNHVKSLISVIEYGKI